MADSKITALTAISTVDPTADPLVIVDVSDTSMAASGTTKKSTINQLLGAGGTATLASATITGAATVGTTLGVTGVSTFAAGTALLPALTTTGDTNTGIYYPAADTFAVTTGGTERYRVDSAGNLGIGVTPSAWASNYKSVQVNPGGGFAGKTDALLLAQNCYFDGTNWVNNRASTYSSRYDMNVAGNSVHAWYVYNAVFGTTGNTIPFVQAMTLTAAGDLLVGQATVAGANIDSFVYNKSGSYAVLSHVSGTGSGTGYIQFLYNNTSIGTITQNGTTGVLYNIVSDYRLKESVVPLSGGLARVNALKPSVYNWKSDGSTGEGFLAHELAEVVPFAVSGEKDAVNADGTIKSQGIDMSRIVPILVAAIQELTAEVNALKNA